MRQILHLDMDAFFAAVEQLDDPTLRGKPVLVGGRSRRGVVAAASYEARPFGVRSAMPMGEALRRCPDAIVVPPRRERYAEVSAQVFEIFHRFTPLVEGLSVDEAFLDVTASAALFGDGPSIARQIKDAVRAETHLTVSAGVARSKFVAKIASDLGKPDGLLVVPENVAAFLEPLPIERMWGVGTKTAPRLHQAGFRTFGDLARADTKQLERLLGSWGASIGLLARGDDERIVEPNVLAKSVGAEETFEEDLTTRSAIELTLLDHAQRVAQRMTRSKLSGRVIQVKLKYADFTVRTRRASLREPVFDTASIYRAACALLDRFELDGARIRLTGVAVGDIHDEPPSPGLFPDEARARRERLEAVVAAAADRFGDGRITRAELKRRGLSQAHWTRYASDVGVESRGMSWT